MHLVKKISHLLLQRRKLGNIVRAYIGQGLREDMERLEGDTLSALIASLKRHGVSDEVIHQSLNEVTQR